MTEIKRRVLSGIQPTGEIHIGNYLGALTQWKELITQYDCFYTIVDYHALTMPYNHKAMPGLIFDTAITLISAGIDPEKCTFFIQSSVPEHTELTWLLNTITPLGLLFRMTQFKDKSRGTLRKEVQKDQKQFQRVKRDIKNLIDTIENESQKIKELKSSINSVEQLDIINEKIGQLSQIIQVGLGLGEVGAGLLNYPVLQAADILIYKAEIVPVGEDQVQHVELTREIAEKFNRFVEKEILPIPKAKIPADTKRIMGLDGRTKMSKSLGNYIGLLETKEQIWEKLKIAFTDPNRLKRTDPGNPDVCNIFTMHQGFSSGNIIEEVNRECRKAGIGCFDCKEKLLNAMEEKLKPMRDKAEDLRNNKNKVIEILKYGGQNARKVAISTVEEVKEAMGIGLDNKK